MSYYGNTKLNQYQQVNTQSAEYADPHRLIQMLMEGFTTRTAEAKAAMERGDPEAKGIAVNKAVGILHGLVDSLDFDRGGSLATNMAAMYFYMERALTEGHASNDADRFDEAMRLMRELKSGWDGIRGESTVQSTAQDDGPGNAQGLSVTG